MDWVENVGVLATVVVAAIAVAVWLFIHRARLNVEVDLERSGFATVEVRRSVPGGAAPETRTGVSIVLRISNPSGRANTVTKISVRAPAPLESLPSDADFVTDTRFRPHPIYDKSITVEDVTYWNIPDGWSTPHHLVPGSQHEAGLTYLLADEPWPKNGELPLKITVSDSHRKRYASKVRLKHD